MRAARAAAGLVGAGIAGVAYAGLVERRAFRLRHVTVPVLRPPARRPLRLLQVSDLHLVPGQDAKLAFVRRCLRAEPDVVVATGDLLGHADAVEPVVETLADLAQGRVALAVLGSNDFFAPRPKNPARYLLGPSTPDIGRRLDTSRLIAGLEGGGWQLLDNRRRQIDTACGPVDVAGLADPHAGWDRPSVVDWSPPDAAVALRLGLVHAPYLRALDVFVERGYDLVLAGHTHGGQLRVPGVGALVDNCDLPLRQARGLSRHRASWLHVSAGLGESRYAPVRFACPPEATILDLLPAFEGAPPDG
ncbi:MAG TPA: metallophosphoesterase [Egibacteraceae bacterium]|nr:metallophosphoesterase [Egibacteraceae bacterium]